MENNNQTTIYDRRLRDIRKGKQLNDAKLHQAERIYTVQEATIAALWERLFILTTQSTAKHYDEAELGQLVTVVQRLSSSHHNVTKIEAHPYELELVKSKCKQVEVEQEKKKPSKGLTKEVVKAIQMELDLM